MRPTILVDTGPLVALLDRKDRYHSWVQAQLEEIEPPLLTCEAVLSEACFLVRQLPGGPQAVLDLIRKGLVVASFSLQSEAASVQQLLMRYANVRMALADACLVRMAELLDHAVVLTVDSDFEIYRKNGRRAIPVRLPEERS